MLALVVVRTIGVLPIVRRLAIFSLGSYANLATALYTRLRKPSDCHSD